MAADFCNRSQSHSVCTPSLCSCAVRCFSGNTRDTVGPHQTCLWLINSFTRSLPLPWFTQSTQSPCQRSDTRPLWVNSYIAQTAPSESPPFSLRGGWSHSPTYFCRRLQESCSPAYLVTGFIICRKRFKLRLGHSRFAKRACARTAH